ncbi:hypothetical protein SMKI_04G3260 [Saccharomyces mikatae IFO 1815]|uniref:Arp10p n=1 Tax=Saccharomyces mikatae IFO 1815 TaxID=226126 RepID=A0AA35IW37_SACMI|nr:uncharacterized protein SMKI_04G3260 [Saccharomyces mikatae IFO 1815]CAI4037989.1 hypothetical protein SMKI_04G3260 [Saccharomyces mikatae IFO 1815]
MPNSTVIIYLGANRIEIGRSTGSCPQEIINWEKDYINGEYRIGLKKILERYFQSFNTLRNHEIQVLILEDIFISVAEKKIICSILFDELYCAYVAFIPRVIVHCLSCNTRNAIVVDVVASHTTCVPIFDLRPLQQYIKYTKRDQEDVHLNKSPTSCPYTSIFFDKEYNFEVYEDDEIPVINLVKGIIDSLPIDLRKPLRENIIIVNIEEKFETTIKELFRENMSSSIIQFSKDYWQAGSACAKTFMHSRGGSVAGLKRDEFCNNPNIVPDWFDFYFKSGVKPIKQPSP